MLHRDVLQTAHNSDNLKMTQMSSNRGDVWYNMPLTAVATGTE
jgi:hypothetical protein